MKIADGLEMLEIPALLENGPGAIHPVVLWDDKYVILVDAGLPDQFPQIKDAMEKATIPFERLSKVIITHHDMDHIGSLNRILNASSQKVDVLAHEAEKPFIEAEVPPVRLSQLEEMLKTIPGARRQRIMSLYENLKENYVKYKASVNKTVSDGEELACCGGIVVIHTPGHTLGHISLYLKQKKILIAGDVMNVENRLLVPSPPATVIDKAASAQSLKKLAQYDIDTVLCYHGGMYNSSDINRRILELASSYEQS